MATILFDQYHLTKVEAKAIIKSMREWFDKNPKKKTCVAKVGIFGNIRFHRDRVGEQVAKLL